MSVVFLDTETTGLDPDVERIFEVALIVDDVERVYRFEPPEDVVARMHPKALEVNRYHERTQGWAWHIEREGYADIAQMVSGRHIVGAVPDFDARFLTAAYKRLGLPVPRWHYHLIDVEALAVGFLAARGESIVLPWISDDLTRRCGVDVPDDGQRHTSLGDARWAKALYEAIVTQRQEEA